MPFIDEIDVKTPIWPTPSNVVSLKSGGTSHSLEDLDAMLEAWQRSGDGWHNCMLACTASYAARGWNEAQIREKLGPYCWRGADDPELAPLVDSALAKFGRKAVPSGLASLLKAADGGAATVVEAPAKPDHAAPFSEKVEWLLATRGQYEDEGRVIKLYEPSDSCRVKPADFRDAFLDWREVRIGPRGGQSVVEATAAWAASPHRIRLDGVRMAPDRSFPLFEEDGRRFKNTYQRPRHTEVAGVSVAPFLAFLKRLIPDEAERNYKLDWMAHKLARPEVPGCAILHVADNDLDNEGAREGRFGTGRGILFSIARALYGPAYCSEQDFRILDGSSGQSVYTDWMHGNVLITCDESPTSATHYRRSERAQAYEVLKRIIDPSVTTRTFTAKYRQAFTGKSHCSIWIATNHGDALAIPEGDRRISVLRNGRLPSREEIAEIVAWRDSAGGIAALATWLERRDIAGFNIYEPLASAAKAAMVEAAISPVEETMLEIGADGRKGMVFFRDDLLAAVRAQHNPSETVNGHFEDAWRRHVTKALDKTGSHRRGRTGGTQRKLFCFRSMAKTVQGLTEDETQRELALWRPVLGLTVIAGSQQKR